jgi:uncharacterized alpha-E superfamily protein
MMLARSAEDLFWVGRYLERSEQTARLLDVTYHRLLGSPHHERADAWCDVLDTVGLLDDYGQRSRSDGDAVARFLVQHDDNPGAISLGIHRLRENSRGAREHLPVELWQAINRFWLDLRDLNVDNELRRRQHHFYEYVRRQCQGVVGVADATWIRSDAWWFFTLGRHLERAILTARLVSVRHPRHDLAAPHEWTSTLRSASALQPHRMLYEGYRDPTTIVSLLVFSDLLPRSVLYSLRQAEVGLRHVDPTGSRQAPRLLSRLRSELEFGTVDELLASGLSERLEQVEDEILRVIAAMSAEFFLEPLQHGVHTLRLGALDSEGERT